MEFIAISANPSNPGQIEPMVKYRVYYSVRRSGNTIASQRFYPSGLPKTTTYQTAQLNFPVGEAGGSEGYTTADVLGFQYNWPCGTVYVAPFSANGNYRFPGDELYSYNPYPC